MTAVVRPVVAPVTQIFGQLPGKPWGDVGPGGHSGTDYGCGQGTPVLSVAAGIVSYAGPALGFGDHAVCIWHAALGVSTTSGHMEAHYVNAGGLVYAGQTIGLADTEGWANGPHLHHEVRRSEALWGNEQSNIDGDLWLHQMGAYGGSPLSPPGQLSAADRQLVIRTQQALHITADGGWGPITDNDLGLIAYTNVTPPNPVRRNTQVAAIQKAWNFPAAQCDGIWGPVTTYAWRALRYALLNK